MSASSDSELNTAADRRQRFRIDETAILEIQPVSDEQADTLLAEQLFSPSASFTLMRALRDIDQENQSLLRAVGERYSDVAAYLSAVNQKVDAIGAAVAEGILPDGQSLESIDLSEGGIGFNCDSRLQEGSLHALKVWFHRALVGVSVFIRVVGCNRSIDGRVHISASFYNMPDSERKIIARHIMMVQAEQQRSRKAQDKMRPEGI